MFVSLSNAPAYADTTENPVATPAPAVSPEPAPVVTPEPTPTPSPEPEKLYNGIAKGKNIIVIQWESLQDLPVNRKLNGAYITPNLNSLIKESIYFKNGISQIAKGTTSDAEFAFSTSCYPPKFTAAFKSLYDRKFVSLPYLMNQAGYTTATFHTNTASFWNRANMYPALGWEKYYDKSFFGTQNMVRFGAADNVLYSKALPELVKMNKSGKPFLVHLITVTSHNPFYIPYWMQTTHFGSAIDYTFTGKYLRTISSADRQLGEFLKALKKNKLYDDSLIVVYGDHFGLGEDKLVKYGYDTNISIIKKILNRNYDKFDLLNVPILFKLPGGEDAKTVGMPAGQLDIMPTILNMAGVENTDGKMFGQDLMNTTENLVGVRFYLPDGSFADNTDFFYGAKNSITYTHKISSVQNLDEKQEAVNSKIAESDKYLSNLKRIKKQ